MGFVLQGVVEGFAALGLSLYYNWKLTLVILASIPISAVILYFISRGIQPNIIRQSQCLSEASEVASNAFTNISLLKYFNTQAQEYRSYVVYVQKAAKWYLKQARSNAMQMGFVRFASTAAFVQGFWYGGTLVHQGSTTPGKVITTFWAAMMAVQAFQDLLPHVIVLAKGQAAAIALRGVLDTVKRGRRFVKKVDGLSPQFCEGDIEVRDVSFAYPSRPEHVVLEPSTFFFPAGETSFIVGKSGSGKSTLGNLLMRFYAPKTGRIMIDRNDIADIDTSWLRNNITLVQQQSILFNETIFKNIAFGHQHHDTVTHHQISSCLDLAALQATIAELPQGVDTMVGAGGSALSGGQKQRIAIARARLRNTPILILDESTSALDHISRTTVMTAIREWRAEKTTIIITHDMTQIRNDDFVYVLDDGYVVAEGYKENVVADLEKAVLSSPTSESNFMEPAPAEASTQEERKIANRPSIRSPRRIRDTKIAPSRSSPKTQTKPERRRDSFEKQLDALTEDLPLHTRLTMMQKTHSSYASNRLTMVAGSAFANFTRQPPIPAIPAMPTKTIYLSNTGNQEGRKTQERQLTKRITGQLARPMSTHQSLVMRSIYTDRRTEKSLPAPQLIEMPRLMRQLSSSRNLQATEEDRPAPSLSIQRILMTVWPNIDTRARLDLILGFMAVCVHAAGPPVFAYVLVHLFQTFYIPHGYKTKALTYSLAILAVAFADGVASFILKYLLEAVAQKWVDALRTSAMTKILSQPKSFFDRSINSPGVLTSSLDRNAEEMRNLLGRFAALIFTVVVMMTISFIWALVTCWKLTLVTFSAAPVLYGLTKAFDSVSSYYESKTNDAAEVIGSIFTETFSDIRTLRSLTLESHFHLKYTLATSACFNIGLRRAFFSGLFFGLSDSAINFITALIFYFGANLARHHSYSTQSILQAFSLLTFSTAAANGVIAFMPQLASSVDTASRLIYLTTLPTTSYEDHGTIILSPTSPTTLTAPIHFINLTFHYPTRPLLPALSNLNLTIPPHLCTAIVGASGSGKSTIASLLLGLYPPSPSTQRTPSDPTTGPTFLTISGRDIRTLHLPTLRSLIAIVPQTPTLIPSTVRQNIVYGLDLNSALTTNANIEDSARQAGIHDFILSLPQQYDTLIGEGGLGVSGGQAQRIVIARALVRRPRVLILDEATSALDNESAGVIRRSVKGLIREGRGDAKNGNGIGRRGMTVIVITHAKEMMEFADWVVVMEGGRNVEEGTYKDLMGRREGKLRELLSGAVGE